MRFPTSLYLAMAKYLVGKKISGEKRFPLVLMLEPTHRCNLNCSGCGRIREYHDTLNDEMSLEDCLQSVRDCGAPVITITGGEPLLYPHIRSLVREVLAMKKQIYFCTNALLLADSLDGFTPNSAFTWNVHFDGPEPIHDAITCRPGTFRRALESVKRAKAMGFRVSTNTTVFRETDVSQLEGLFTQLTEAGVDGILVAPGFSYEEVTGDVFLEKEEIRRKFVQIRKWSDRFPFISNPIYLDFLCGDRTFRCTPWGNPTRNPRGWKSPCYLITDTHYATYRELMEKTDWDYYVSGKDPRCAQCMMHCGFEPSIVLNMSGADLLTMLRWNVHV